MNGKKILIAAGALLSIIGARHAQARQVSWTVIQPSFPAQDISACEDGVTVYALYSQKVIVSTDGGIGWTVLPGSYAPWAQSVACGNGNVIYAFNYDRTLYQWNAASSTWQYVNYLWDARAIAGGMGTTFPFYAINSGGSIWYSEITSSSRWWGFTNLSAPTDIGVIDFSVVHGNKLLYGAAPGAVATPSDDGLRVLDVFSGTPWQTISRVGSVVPISGIRSVAALDETKVFALDKVRLLEGTVTP